MDGGRDSIFSPSRFTHKMIENLIGNLSDVELPKKPSITLPKKRVQQIPNFTLKDITGDFNIDKETGSMIVLKNGESKQFVDLNGRRVNKRGYCVDREGNIVLKNGAKTVVFKYGEIE